MFQFESAKCSTVAAAGSTGCAQESQQCASNKIGRGKVLVVLFIFATMNTLRWLVHAELLEDLLQDKGLVQGTLLFRGEEQ